MRKALPILCLLSLTLTLSHTQDTLAFQAILSGYQQSVPVPTTGNGQVEATLIGDTLTVSGTFSGLTSAFNPNVAGGAHIHLGLPGNNGGIIFPLKTTLNTDEKSGAFPADSNQFIVDSAQRAQLTGQQLYVNIHTVRYAGGEIRGQLLAAADNYFIARPFGSNVPVPVASTGGGVLLFSLQGDQLSAVGSVANLMGGIDTTIAGGAHIHNGLAGQSGSIAFPLTFDFSDSTGRSASLRPGQRFSLDASQQQRLFDQGYYVNIHTTQVPSGEIRGQLLPLGSTLFRAYLTGASQPTQVLTRGGGMLSLVYQDSTLTVTGSFSDLTSALQTSLNGGLHIHGGMAGTNGGIVFPLSAETDSATSTSGTLNAGANTFKLDSAQIATLFSRGFYINVHSANFPGGELRGQILPQSNAFFQGVLNGMQQTTPVYSPGTGQLALEIRGTTATLSGSFNNLSSTVMTSLFGGAHLHIAALGANGPIATPIVPTLNSDSTGGIFAADPNTVSIRQGLIDTLMMRWVYANIHTANHAGGELRAQMVPESRAYFLAFPSGGSATIPVTTAGRGRMMGEYTGNKLILHGSFNQLSGKVNTAIAGGAHLHAALAGSNGPIVYPLSMAFAADSTGGLFPAAQNVFTISGSAFDTLAKRMIYLNIHTTYAGSGEIRGQLLPIAQAYLETNLSAKNASQLNPSNASGKVILELNGSNGTVSGSFNNLTSPLAVNIAGGAHIHDAPLAQNGPIAIPLRATLAPDALSGVFPSDSNKTTSIAADVLENVLAGNSYVNIHSLEFPSGEIRGQLLPILNQAPATVPGFLVPMINDTVMVAKDSVFYQTWQDTLAVAWEQSIDPDANAISYTYQSSLIPNFDLPLLTFSTGTHPTFAIPAILLDTFLNILGVTPGTTIPYFHKVEANDGSLSSSSLTGTVFLTREVTSSILQWPETVQSLQAYPSPAVNQLTITMVANESGPVDFYTYGLDGQLLLHKTFPGNAGAQSFELPVQDLNPGIYITWVCINHKTAASIKWIKG